MRIIWTVGVLAVLGCACGGARATVSTRAAALTVAPPQASAFAVSRLRMVVERVRLTPASQEQQSGTEGDSEVGAGPFLLDLSGDELTGTVSHAFDISAPAGSYSAVKLRIHALDGAEAPAGSALAEMAGHSIALDGTSNGAAFSFTSSLDEDQERQAPLSIGSGETSNITLSFDTSRWFSDGAGGALDPAVAENRSQIENNIKASLDAFEDDDLDGHQDAH